MCSSMCSLGNNLCSSVRNSAGRAACSVPVQVQVLCSFVQRIAATARTVVAAAKQLIEPWLDACVTISFRTMLLTCRRQGCSSIFRLKFHIPGIRSVLLTVTMTFKHFMNVFWEWNLFRYAHFKIVYTLRTLIFPTIYLCFWWMISCNRWVIGACYDQK